ncbi:MAG: hypothetical protein LC798_01130 [Chloroflexi bacterium]|nr:hypothetical protein [Chloroflexota bacterium]
MDLALMLIGLGIVTILVVAWISVAAAIKQRRQAWLEKKRRRARPPVKPSDPDHGRSVVDDPEIVPPEPPTFRVMALGLEGSGKTVLLASQFHMLNGPIGDCRFFLDGDLRQDQLLFGHLGNPKAPWPAGSQLGDIREFLFDCQAYDRAQAVRTVFRISYLDYAGDLLEPRRDHHEAADEIEKKVMQAHALLVVIDGQRVLQLLNGEREARDYFKFRLQPLLRLAGRASCPIQLIVSKWDLVRRPGQSDEQDEGRLQEVKACLEPYLNIEHLLRGSPGRPQQKARLIPVSAVGPAYAEVRADGSVTKLPNGELAPINAEVPLCAVLPDVIEQAALSLAGAPDVRQEVDEEVRRSRTGSLATIVRSVLSSPAGSMLRKTLSGIVGEEVVRLLVEMLVREKAQEEPPPPGSEAIDADVTRLRAAVIAAMKLEVRLFEKRLESSKPRTRW